MCFTTIKNNLRTFGDKLGDVFDNPLNIGQTLKTATEAAAALGRATGTPLMLLSDRSELSDQFDGMTRDIKEAVGEVGNVFTNADGQAENAQKIADAQLAAGQASTAAQLGAMNAAARAAADQARLAAERDKAAKTGQAQEVASPDVAIDDPGSSNTVGAIRRRRAIFGRNNATGVRI